MSPSSGSFFPLFCGLDRVASSSFVLSSKERKPEGSCCATTWPFDWISFFLRILSLTSNPGYKNTTHVGNMCQLSSKKVPKNVGRLLCRLSIVAILRSGSVLSGLNTSVRIIKKKG